MSPHVGDDLDALDLDALDLDALDLDALRAIGDASPHDLAVLERLERAELAAGSPPVEMISAAFHGQDSGWPIADHGLYTVPGWCRMLRDPPHHNVPDGALQCLRAMGPKAVAAVPAILEAVPALPEYLLPFAVKVLGSITTDAQQVGSSLACSPRASAVIGALLRSLRPPEYRGQEWCLRVLAHCAQQHAPAARALANSLALGSAALARLLAAELARVANPGAVTARLLHRTLRAVDGELRAAVVSALAACASGEGLQVVIKALCAGHLRMGEARGLGWERERNARTVVPTLAATLVAGTEEEILAALEATTALLAEAVARRALLASRATQGERAARDARNELDNLREQLRDLAEALPELALHTSVVFRDAARAPAAMLVAVLAPTAFG